MSGPERRPGQCNDGRAAGAAPTSNRNTIGTLVDAGDIWTAAAVVAETVSSSGVRVRDGQLLPRVILTPPAVHVVVPRK